MRSMQVRATQLQAATDQARGTQPQDATDAQLEAMRARSRELRLRVSDLTAREQQVRELRYQVQATSPDRAPLDKQWMDVRHSLSAASIELDGLTERIGELRLQRDQARAVALRPAPTPEPPPVEVPGMANAGYVMLALFVAPVALILVFRLVTRRSAPRDPLGLDTSVRFQRLEQTVETIAMEVERIAEGQRFTTAILAERIPGAAPRTQVTPRQGQDAIAPQ